MNLTYDLRVEIRAEASSQFTPETIERRLAELFRQAAGEVSVMQEIVYLEALRKEKWG